MKIYTRTGDKGKTTLVSGRPVPKTHVRIEAYGTVDELIAHIGMLRDMAEDDTLRAFLLDVQDRLMTCAAILASDCEDCEVKIPEIREADILNLESAIDLMEASLPTLKSFVLPGGHVISSQCHIARTVCRRAERQIIRLSSELFVPDTVIKYINRLSDYLFVLARKVLRDLQKEDIPWKPKL
ncbi:MAG: cob(I)yrinic acid a,c-diamide adenosyltransferase [Bacteroidales bacterium]|nr:cob(I)yrinic acid a,c-diamide adenosyltransferase [Bacteroidales bacterium]